jgi:cell division protein FtsL
MGHRQSASAAALASRSHGFGVNFMSPAGGMRIPSIEERASLAQNFSAQMNRDHLAHDYSDLQITTSRHHNSRITHVVGSINSLKHFNN